MISFTTTTMDPGPAAHTKHTIQHSIIVAVSGSITKSSCTADFWHHCTKLQMFQSLYFRWMAKTQSETRKSSLSVVALFGLLMEMYSITWRSWCWLFEKTRFHSFHENFSTWLALWNLTNQQLCSWRYGPFDPSLSLLMRCPPPSRSSSYTEKAPYFAHQLSPWE